MHLHLKLKTINYGDIAVKAMPMLVERQGIFPGFTGLILDAFAGLPEGLVREVFDTLSVERKNQIVAAFASEKKNQILSLLNRVSAERGLGVTLSDYEMGDDLSVDAEIGAIDYLGIAEKLLPAVKARLSAMDNIPGFVRMAIKFANAQKIMSILDNFVCDKNAFVASLINQSDQRVIAFVEKLAADQNIYLEVALIHVEA